MEGVVKFVNEEMQVFAVHTDNGFTVLEYMEANYIETGDVVSGSLESISCHSLLNRTRNSELLVCVLNIVPTLLDAEALVFSD